MSIERDDPKLTAYALGELDAAENTGIEKLLADDPDARRVVEETRQLAARIEAALKSEPPVDLTPDHRTRIDEAIATKAKVIPFPRGRILWLAGTAAAAIVVASSALLWQPWRKQREIATVSTGPAPALAPPTSGSAARLDGMDNKSAPNPILSAPVDRRIATLDTTTPAAMPAPTVTITAGELKVQGTLATNGVDALAFDAPATTTDALKKEAFAKSELSTDGRLRERDQAAATASAKETEESESAKLAPAEKRVAQPQQPTTANASGATTAEQKPGARSPAEVTRDTIAQSQSRPLAAASTASTEVPLDKPKPLTMPAPAPATPETRATAHGFARGSGTAASRLTDQSVANDDSFAKIRASLEAGRLPAADAVDMQALVRHFTFRLPEIGKAGTLSIRAASTASPWDPQKQVVLIASISSTSFNDEEAATDSSTAKDKRSAYAYAPVRRAPASGATAGNKRDRDADADVKVIGPAGGFFEVSPGANRTEQDRSAVVESLSRTSGQRVEVSVHDPASGTSAVVQVAVTSEARDTAEVRFAAAVAEFAMLLRHTPPTPQASYDDVLKLAREAAGNDPTGERKEFIGLVEKARDLAKKPR